MTKLLEKINSNGQSVSEKKVPYEIFNIGNSKMESLEDFICIIEKNIGKKAIKNYLDMQLGDMQKTSANIDKIKAFVNFSPKTPISVGLPVFINWYKNFYK